MIAIPLDPTNLGRALLLLENRIDYAETRQGVVAHRPGHQRQPAPLPNHGAGRRAAAARAGRSKGHRCRHQHHHINQTGLTPTKDGIFIEDKDSPYTNIIVTREDNKDAPNVQNFIKAYESDEVAKAAEKSSTAARWRLVNSATIKADSAYESAIFHFHSPFPYATPFSISKTPACSFLHNTDCSQQRSVSMPIKFAPRSGNSRVQLWQLSPISLPTA